MAVSELVTGPHVTFVDPRKHGDTRAMIDHAKRLYKMFKAQGIRPEYIVFSVSRPRRFTSGRYNGFLYRFQQPKRG